MIDDQSDAGEEHVVHGKKVGMSEEPLRGASALYYKLMRKAERLRVKAAKAGMSEEEYRADQERNSGSSSY